MINENNDQKEIPFEPKIQVDNKKRGCCLTTKQCGEGANKANDGEFRIERSQRAEEPTAKEPKKFLFSYQEFQAEEEKKKVN